MAIDSDDSPDESTRLLSRRPAVYKVFDPRYGVLRTAGRDVEVGSAQPCYSDTSSPRLRTKPSSKALPISDYPAIDGLHDLFKDSLRLRSRAFYSRGFSAGAIRAWDAASGWVAAALMGALTATVAFLVDVSVVTVSGWKEGYCRTAWYKSRSTCCAETSTTLSEGSVGAKCEDWIPWSGNYASSYAIYVGLALVFGTFSGLVTYTTKKTLPSNTPSKRSVDAASTYQSDGGEAQSAGINGHGNEHASRASKKEGTSPGGKVIYMASGSGIPEIKTIISGYDIPNYLDLKVLVTKAIGSVFAVSTGMCLGKEGPFVHISVCVAYLVGTRLSKYRDNGRKLRETLSVGCAAGLCVAFGAPIGGVLFSFEEISTQFPRRVLWRAFLCSLVAAAVLKYLNPTGTGKLVLFETGYNTTYEPRFYIVFVVLGIAGGIFGGVFCRLNFLWSKFFRGFAIIKNNPVFEAALVTLVTALTQYVNEATREPGDVIVVNLLVDCSHPGKQDAWVCVNEQGDLSSRVGYMAWLVYGMFIKLFLTVITFGVKVPSGIIIPALNAGAFFGRFLGQFAIVSKTLQPGIFAMVGGVAFLAGVCRMTISLAVILFELTGEVEYVIPNMIGILVAKWVADAIEPEGVYDLAQTLSGHPFLEGETAVKMAQREANFVDQLIPPEQDMQEMTLEVPSSGLLHTDLIWERLDALKSKGLRNPGLVLVRDETLIGFLTEVEFESGLRMSGEKEVDVFASKTCQVAPCLSGEQTPARYDVSLMPFIDYTPTTISYGATIEHAVELFSKLNLGYIFLTDKALGNLCAVITKKHLLDWLNQRKYN